MPRPSPFAADPRRNAGRPGPSRSARLLGCVMLVMAVARPAAPSDALGPGLVATRASVHSHDQTDPGRRPTPPRPKTFAAIDDVEAVPLRAEAGRQDYRRFLAAGSPRAFAVAEDGTAWAWNAEGAEAVASTVSRCEAKAKGPCRLYAVGANVVWSGARVPER